MEKVKIRQATKMGYIECEVGGVADFSYPTSELRRGRVQGGGNICPTITAQSMGICRIEENLKGKGKSMQGNRNTNRICARYRIRKLTPLECWRLMGFSDEDFHKAELGNSNTQLYKQAGNSIVENVLVAIFGQMLPGKENVYKELGNKNYNKEME